MDIPKEELEDVIHKMERVLKKVDYQSVPPLVYQLVLVVRSKLPGRVLQVVINYFNRQDLKVGSSQDQDPPSDINTMDLMDDDAIGEDALPIFHCLHHNHTCNFLMPLTFSAKHNCVYNLIFLTNVHYTWDLTTLHRDCK